VESVYVLDDQRRLVGAARLAQLFAAPREAQVHALMRAEPPVVRPDLDREEAASLAIRRELAAVPVVAADGGFLGVFPAPAIMRVLRQEHLEDLHHMAGIWHHS
ncbi:MAG: CBS domain-containing protein, partial [Gammaproteobacteria bacterium]|nr:CBS domain-containing protein [Gammaproteobacteria bacterium]NIR83920.1 CBS domain-containing protein [Gammaproteobacteria bacterium]NIU05212.1 CBS domain-containing protein [Gammaproteobacteria bacterium]NIV52066.1 CBS domain-containing protein [Gammaproteobacteria bacterium]NIX86485.1 CBS domain-containing protein [Gammaproteobacteria bacterium]